MALPNGYPIMEYFREVISLLHNYKFLYHRTNNDLFKYNILDSFSNEWAIYFETITANELIELGLEKEIKNAPESLNNFIKTINKLNPQHERISNVPISIKTTKGLGIKKQHEIALLAPLILNHCQMNNIKYVIDIGCGLGYLTNLLKEHNLNILGIDGNLKFIQTAQQKYPNIPFEHLFVTTESSDILLVLLKKHFKEFDEKSQNVCLIALHACADLTIDMLKLFLTISPLKVAIVMPCCYHRMKKVEGRQEFINFPLSKLLMDSLNMINVPITTNDRESCEEVNFNGSFLRLACQRVNWCNQTPDQLHLQIKNLMFRNLLELVVYEGNFRIQRKRRKTGSHSENYNLNDFLTNLQNSYNITKSNNANLTAKEYEQIRILIREKYENIYQQKELFIGAFIALQSLIQPLCENLVLLDRCAFINQTRVAECVTVKVTDECISPRCFALVTTKPGNHCGENNKTT